MYPRPVEFALHITPSKQHVVAHHPASTQGELTRVPFDLRKPCNLNASKTTLRTNH